MITWENYEEYLCLYADGELTPADEQQLLAFISLNPELQKELDAFGRARMTPDEQVTFANKDILLKPERISIMYRLKPVFKYGIAAGMALLAVLLMHNRITQSVSQKQLAITSHTTIRIKTQVPPSNEQITPVTTPATAPAPVSPLASMDSKYTKTKTLKIKNMHSVSSSTNKIAVSQPFINADLADAGAENKIKTRIEFTSLPVATVPQIPAELKYCLPPMVELPGRIAVKGTSALKSFWNRVPLDKRNKRQIESVAGIIANSYNEIVSRGDNRPGVQIKSNQLIISIN